MGQTLEKDDEPESPRFAVGTAITLQDLQVSRDLNGSHGVICSPLGENGRFVVKLESGETMKVKPSNLVQRAAVPKPSKTSEPAPASDPGKDAAAPKPSKASEPAQASDPGKGLPAVDTALVWELHVTEDWTEEGLRAAIKTSSFTIDPNGNEYAEKAWLNRNFGWRETRLLMGYSKDAEYKDLIIYFDSADKTSPINRPATKAFKCYGLDGNQGVMDWDVVRGVAVIIRSEPSTLGGVRIPCPFVPNIPMEEIVQTLLFFKDRDARDVALRRDAQRFRKYGTAAAAGLPSGLPPDCYFGPAGVRDWGKVVGSDCAVCDACGRASALAGGLKRCACRRVAYCGKDCQRADWPRHRSECDGVKGGN